MIELNIESILLHVGSVPVPGYGEDLCSMQTLTSYAQSRQNHRTVLGVYR